jgi:hypothetical protein
MQRLKILAGIEGIMNRHVGTERLGMGKVQLSEDVWLTSGGLREELFVGPDPSTPKGYKEWKHARIPVTSLNTGVLVAIRKRLQALIPVLDKRDAQREKVRSDMYQLVERQLLAPEPVGLVMIDENDDED